MAGIFQSFMTGVEGGRASFDRQRARQGQERAAGLMTAGDRTGAARELMATGQFGEAATLSNVSMVNQRQDALQRAGTAAAGGNYGQASTEMFNSGAIDEGKAFDTERRNRESGAALMDDPAKAAALQATGGDIAQATQILDWSQRLDATEREQVLARAKVTAPLLVRAAQLPYEQRRAFIEQNSQALGGAGFTPEQVAQFDPTDEAIRAMTDTTLGLEAVLGSYSQRVVGDEVRTYRTNPYGVERTGSEPVPYSRDEARDDKRLQFEEERIGLQREALAVANTTGDVLAPLLQRYSQGQPLNAQETEIVQSYLSRIYLDLQARAEAVTAERLRWDRAVSAFEGSLAGLEKADQLPGDDAKEPAYIAAHGVFSAAWQALIDAPAPDNAATVYKLRAIINHAWNEELGDTPDAPALYQRHLNETVQESAFPYVRLLQDACRQSGIDHPAVHLERQS